MNDILITTELEAFNTLFNQLAHQPNHICWIRSTDFSRQLYLSPQFETVFERPTSLLYEHPESWYDLLFITDKKNMLTVMPKRIAQPKSHNGKNLVFYRITTPSGTTRYIRDWSILLRNKSNEFVAVAGVAEQIPPELWYAAQESLDTKSIHSLPCGKSLLSILEQEKKIEVIKSPSPQKDRSSILRHFQINNVDVHLSKREAECLYQLRLGKTAKESAKALNISPRTVETHLENIKQKTLCKTKLELMSQIMPSEYS